MASSRFTTGTRGSLYTRNLASQVYIEEIGDWHTLSTRLGTLPKAAKLSVLKSLNFYARKYHKGLLIAIDTNGQGLDKPWAPLSPLYSARKSKAGGNPGIYQWTGILRGAIEVKTSPELVSVGINKDASGSANRSDLSASQIARILQVGSMSRNIPARPLFPAVWKQMGGNAALATYVKKNLNTNVKDHLLNIKT